MPKKIKPKLSKSEKKKYVDKWLKLHGLTRGRIQAQAYIDNMGTLSEDEFYIMARGYTNELRRIHSGQRE